MLICFVAVMATMWYITIFVIFCFVFLVNSRFVLLQLWLQCGISLFL